MGLTILTRYFLNKKEFQNIQKFSIDAINTLLL